MGKGLGKDRQVREEIKQRILSLDEWLDTLSSGSDVAKEELVDELRDFLEVKYGSSKTSPAQIRIPVEIFSYSLSGLEALVWYLKDYKNLSLSTIATLLNRNPATIWTSYQHALLKNPPSSLPPLSSFFFSASLFSSRDLSVFEWVVYTLKNSDRRFSQIAQLLNRDQRNMAATYKRALGKIGGKKK